RGGVARHRPRRDDAGNTGCGRLPVAGVQQPRLLAHHPERPHDRRDRLPARPADGPGRGARAGQLMAYVEVRGLQKAYVTRRGRTPVLGGVDLSLDEGEFVAVVGYSGSGKTTLVSLLGGLIEPGAGEGSHDGGPGTWPCPERGIVFPQYSL